MTGQTTPILEVDDISLRFGGVRALTDVSFNVNKGELFSIIGPNGAGKTSLLNCVSGRYSPQEGSATGDSAPVESGGNALDSLMGGNPEQDPPSDGS